MLADIKPVQVKHKISFLYLERADIKVDNSALVIFHEGLRTQLPIAQICTLMLGPGTKITHDALCTVLENHASICIVSDKSHSIYGHIFDDDRSAANLLRQISYHEDSDKHLLVAKKMYQKRFPEMDTTEKTLQQLRGMEGIRVVSLYKHFAAEYDIDWKGRNNGHDSWNSMDTSNKLLSIGNQFLYAICDAVIFELGFSPAIGFIHTGAMGSFLFDVADLYKADIVIPAAFEQAAQDNDSAADLRKTLRGKIVRYGLLQTIINDLYEIFDMKKAPEISVSNALWDNLIDFTEASKNYGKLTEDDADIDIDALFANSEKAEELP